MPDVIIWMIKGGTQRIAYCRIPAHELLYTSDKEQQGINCGKIIDVILKVCSYWSCEKFYKVLLASRVGA